MESKQIEGFDYKIDRCGNITSNRSGKLMAPVKNSLKKPYIRVGLSRSGKRYFFLVHRLVAEAFIPNPKSLPLVNHKNEVKSDNRAENLEWITNKDNARHSNKRIINQIEGDIIVKKYTSLFSIKDEGIYNITKVSECCNNKRKQHKGYKWQYV